MPVVKIGGSILRDQEGYRRVAELLAQSPAVAVVSAAHGVTDRLLAGADPAALWAHHEQLAGAPLPQRLRRRLEQASSAPAGARLVAWGEQASCEVLRSHLLRLGRSPPILERGQRCPIGRRLVLVPGFYESTVKGPVLLPRGGSDITAARLATELAEPVCVYWKEGGGLRIGQEPVPTASWTQVLAHIGLTISPLHPEAVLHAQRHGLRLVMQDPWGKHPATVIE